MPIRTLFLSLGLLWSCLAWCADPPPEAPAAPAPPAEPAPASAPAQEPAPGPVFPRLMSEREAAQPPAPPARVDESAALRERVLAAARSLRNMGMLTLSAVLGLFGSALAGVLIALAVHTLRERRAARKAGG